jgi:hypothetical protein
MWVCYAACFFAGVGLALSVGWTVHAVSEYIQNRRAAAEWERYCRENDHTQGEYDAQVELEAETTDTEY